MHFFTFLKPALGIHKMKCKIYFKPAKTDFLATWGQQKYICKLIKITRCPCPGCRSYVGELKTIFHSGEELSSVRFYCIHLESVRFNVYSFFSALFWSPPPHQIWLAMRAVRVNQKSTVAGWTGKKID